MEIPCYYLKKKRSLCCFILYAQSAFFSMKNEKKKRIANSIVCSVFWCHKEKLHCVFCFSNENESKIFNFLI